MKILNSRGFEFFFKFSQVEAVCQGVFQSFKSRFGPVGFWAVCGAIVKTREFRLCLSWNGEFLRRCWRITCSVGIRNGTPSILILNWGASYLWSPSLHFPMRNSGQMTIRKTHPTLFDDKYYYFTVKSLLDHLLALKSSFSLCLMW